MEKIITPYVRSTCAKSRGINPSRPLQRSEIETTDSLLVRDSVANCDCSFVNACGLTFYSDRLHVEIKH